MHYVVINMKSLHGDVDPMLFLIAFVIAIGMSLYQYFSEKKKSNLNKKLHPSKTNKDLSFEKLTEHTGELSPEPEILTLLKGKIHVAIGYGLANCILIEGPNSCIVIDTMECYEAANDVLEAFQNVIKDKPIEAIILTHFHADHTYGFDVFVEKFPKAKVYAHETLQGYFQQLSNVRAAITAKRAVFQFGTELNKGEHENSGIGLKLRYDLRSKLLVTNILFLGKDSHEIFF